MSESVDPSLHPIRGALATIDAALDRANGLEPVFMTTHDKETVLRELARTEAWLVALRMRIMAEASDVAEHTGARDLGAWWADALHADIRAARADLRLAHAVEGWPGLASALAEGRISIDHARVIARALTRFLKS